MKNANEMNLETIDGLTHASIHLLDQIDEQDEIIIAQKMSFESGVGI
mgnify:CR=1 FL=1